MNSPGLYLNLSVESIKQITYPFVNSMNNYLNSDDFEDINKVQQIVSEIDLRVYKINKQINKQTYEQNDSLSTLVWQNRSGKQQLFIIKQVITANQTLKSQLDQMLGKDYNEWRAKRGDFNAVNSQIAHHRQLLTQYIHGIYHDYRIPDPLLGNQSRYRMSFSQQKRHSMPPKISKIQKPHGEKPPLQLISTNEAYSTPTKHKKGLELVNPKQSQISVSMPRQKLQYQYLTPEKVKPFQQSRMKIAERTAPSLNSSFMQGNSMNQGFSQTEMSKNLPMNGNFDTSLFHSRLSLASRLPDHSNHKSRKTTLTDAKLQFTDLKQPPSLFSTPQKTYPYLTEQKSKTYSYLTDKDEAHITFGIEQASEKKYSYHQLKTHQERVKSQRQNQLQRYQNKLYAQRVSSNLYQLDKIAFNPQNGSIKQSFRYCIGCQQPILEANIKIHQIQCLEFKRILNLKTVQEITQQIETKIQKILKQIQQKTEQVHESDPQKIVSSSRTLISQIKDFKKIKQDELLNHVGSQSFNWEYDKVIGIGKKWGQLTEEVNKLKWFLVVKNNFLMIRMQKSS